MTASTIILGAGGEPVEAVAAAIGDWCRRWPEKVLARDFGVAIQTAKKWRRGTEMPAGRHLVAMAGRWGRPFIDHAFRAVIDGATLEHRLEALEASFALIRQDLSHAPSQADRPADCLGTPEGRGVARAAGKALATARTLIAGIVIGAAILHTVAPHLPRSVADLRADLGSDSDGLRPKNVRVVIRPHLARTART